MTRLDAWILLGIPAIVVAFCLYEAAALDGWIPFHTVSWYSQQPGNHWLDYGITGLIAGVGLGGVLIWRRHMRSRIPR